jgi:hypothetical protein
LQHMPIKGRNSCKEKEAEKVADIILRSTTWEITNNTPFSVVEQLLLMLWCVTQLRCSHLLSHTSTQVRTSSPMLVSAANDLAGGRTWTRRHGRGVLGVVWWPLTRDGTIRELRRRCSSVCVGETAGLAESALTKWGTPAKTIALGFVSKTYMWRGSHARRWRCGNACGCAAVMGRNPTEIRQPSRGAGAASFKRSWTHS